MPAYIVSCGINATLSIAPVTWQVRISRLEGFSSSATVYGNVSSYKYSPSTLSGGSSVTPITLRDGTAAALATVKTGATPSGTQLQLTGTVVPPNQMSSYQLAFDLIIKPGSVFHVITSTASADVQFEELHLARSV